LPECFTDADCIDADPCTTDACVIGQCEHDPVANGGACSDGIACTAFDTCNLGVCTGQDHCPPSKFCNHDSGACEVPAGDPDADGLVGAADPCAFDTRNWCFGPLAVDTATGRGIRVNANVSTAECSGVKVDCAGDTWFGDFGYSSAQSAATCNLGGGGEGCVITGVAELFGCEDETTEDLFQCEHSDRPAAPELSYTFAVPDGRYLVNLFFANTYTGTTAAGARKFDIRIEGALVYDDFDQVVAAGGSGIAVLRSAVVTVSDGNGLRIEFGHVTENPSVKAIEIFAEAPLTTTTLPPTTTLGQTTTTTESGTTTTLVPECAANADCVDADQCTSDVCAAGQCLNNAAPNGTPCNDGIACTGPDVCTGTVCAGSSSCAAGHTCNLTTGQCVPSGDPDRDGMSGPADPCPFDPRNACFGPAAVDAIAGHAIRVNANVSNAECSGAKTDCAGDTWFGDFGYSSAQSAATCNLAGGGEACVIGGIVDLFGCEDETTEDLFQCEHSDKPAAPELSYSFAVTNGQYLVNLFFANTYTGTATAGARKFDVHIEGQLVLDDFDQVAAAGGSGIAVVRSAIVEVADSNGLQILFGHVVENPSIKAIEVLSAPANPSMWADSFAVSTTCSSTSSTTEP
jgi:hypothetical protein